MIVNLNEIVDGEVEFETPLSSPCKLCRTILYDDNYFTNLKVGAIRNVYFYCDECSDEQDQEISFHKKFKVKSIAIDLEEMD